MTATKKSLVDGSISNILRNRILDAMSIADLALLQPHLQAVPLKFRQRLQCSSRPISDVYFPESGIASVVAVAGGERRQAEIALVGREGMTGLPVVYGAGRSPCDVFMQVEGYGLRISAHTLREAMFESLSLLHCLLLYAHVFNVQTGYTALANARGSISERLARWLLMARDRAETDGMSLTHELLAGVLGVRRAGVTGALHYLEGKGLVGTHRGLVTIKDRRGLEECANGLYGVPEIEFERLFGSGRKESADALFH
jgi:CRP-like cAMP-binding protein